MSAPEDFELREYSSELEGPVCSLWQEVFGYPERRNSPREILLAKLRWDGDSRGILVALETTEGECLLGTLMVGYDGHRGWLYRLAVARLTRAAEA